MSLLQNLMKSTTSSPVSLQTSLQASRLDRPARAAATLRELSRPSLPALGAPRAARHAVSPAPRSAVIPVRLLPPAAAAVAVGPTPASGATRVCTLTAA